MSGELIRKSDVLNLLNNIEVGECPYNCVGAALITIHDAVEDMPPVNAVELPCKIEDKVFEPIPKGGTIYSRTVKGFTVSDRVELINCETKNFYRFELGKKVFLTSKEAERALEDLKNENK